MAGGGVPEKNATNFGWKSVPTFPCRKFMCVPETYWLRSAIPDCLEHLERVLEEINPEVLDVVAVVVHRLSLMASGEHPLDVDQICSEREIEALSKIVSIAEKAGKH